MLLAYYRPAEEEGAPRQVLWTVIMVHRHICSTEGNGLS